MPGVNPSDRKIYIVGWLITARLHYLPDAGDRLKTPGLNTTVQEVTKRAVVRLRVETAVNADEE